MLSTLFTAIMIVVAAVLSAIAIIGVVELCCYIVMGIRLVLAEFDPDCKYLECHCLFGTWEFWVDGHGPKDAA